MRRTRPVSPDSRFDPTKREERQLIATAIADAINELQPRRIAALHAAARQVREAVAGTWLEDRIMIRDGEVPSLDYPYFGDTYAATLNKQDVYPLAVFPSTEPAVPHSSTELVKDAVYRLLGGVPSSCAPKPLNDWEAVSQYSVRLRELVTVSLDEAWAWRLSVMSPLESLATLRADMFERLVDAPAHRFWSFPGGPRVDTYFQSEAPEYEVAGRMVLRDVAKHCAPSEDKSVRKLLLWAAESMSRDLMAPNSTLGTADLIFSRMTAFLIRNPGDRLTTEAILAAIVEVIPSAALAAARYEQHLTEHPDRRIAEWPSLRDVYDAAIAKWREDLPAGYVEQTPVVGKRLPIRDGDGAELFKYLYPRHG